jgi:hypothetical protein
VSKSKTGVEWTVELEWIEKVVLKNGVKKMIIQMQTSGPEKERKREKSENPTSLYLYK